LSDLERYVEETNNRRLKGVIKKLKLGDRLDEKILALASIIQSLRRKNVSYSERFLNDCVAYLTREII